MLNEETEVEGVHRFGLVCYTCQRKKKKEPEGEFF